MNRKILLSLLAIPSAMGAMLTPLLIATVAIAADSSNVGIHAVTAQASCDAPEPSTLHSSVFKQHRTIFVASAGKVSGDDFAIDFSAAESDAAVQLFGCDCPPCIRSLRQLQRQSLSQQVLASSSSPGHCLANLQRRVSPETLKDVLKTLEQGKAS